MIYSGIAQNKPMLRRLLQKVRRPAPPSGVPINLFEDSGDPVGLPAPIGISSTPRCSAWTTSRLERILRRCQVQPGHETTLLEARHARYCLSDFWLTAPADQLEAMYRGPIGQAYRLLLFGPLPALPLASDEQAWKDEIARALQERFGAPERTNLLLAVMPYCAPGRMKLTDARSDLPPWLLADYSRCFDPDLPRSAEQPIGLLRQSAPAPSSGQPMDFTSAVPAPSMAPPPVPPTSPAPSLSMPQLSERRGSEAFALFQNSEFNERMRALINLFTVDPSDQQVQGELNGLRRLIGQVWLDVTPNSLESLYRSPMGAIYRELLASNFGATPCEGEDLALRQALDQMAINPSHAFMSQALMAAMLFHPQGKMRLGQGASRLPLWLQQDFPTLAGL